MVPQVKCAMMVRGSKRACDNLMSEWGWEKEKSEKEKNHYAVLCTDYYPCDMLLDYSFEELAEEFCVDIAYMFCEYSNQLCQYDEDYNLKCFLNWNGLEESGVAYGFDNETGFTDDLQILKDFLSDGKGD